MGVDWNSKKESLQQLFNRGVSKSKNKDSDRVYRYATKRSGSLEMMSAENPLNGER